MSDAILYGTAAVVNTLASMVFAKILFKNTWKKSLGFAALITAISIVINPLLLWIANSLGWFPGIVYAVAGIIFYSAITYYALSKTETFQIEKPVSRTVWFIILINVWSIIYGVISAAIQVLLTFRGAV